MAASLASASLFSSSPSWDSRVLLAWVREVVWSCSDLSSSARRAASTMAFFAFSSEFLAWCRRSSISACMVWRLPSTRLLSELALELMVFISLTALRASPSSASVCLLPRSAESRRALASSTSPWRALARRSARLAFSDISCLSLQASSYWHSASLSCPWYLLMDLRASLLALLAWSRAISNSLMSDSSFFLILRPSSVVLAGVVELLLLLSNPAVNLLLHLSQLKLSSQHLVLLSLESTLSLLKSSLEFLLLGLESAALFVKFVDGATSISKLVKRVLDFISQVLVLTTNNVKLFIGLVQSSLETESLSVEVAALRVAGVKLSHQIISLGLPLSNNLVKVASSLLGDHGGGVSSLVLHGQLLQLSVHPGLGLLSGGNLGVQVLNHLLSLLDTRSKLGLASLQLINATKSLNLVLGLPELDLSLGLGQTLESIILLLVLLVNAHAQVLSLSHEVLVLGEQSSSVTSLGISQSLGVLQLSGQRDLVLLQSSDGVLTLLDLTSQVLGLNLQLLLGGVSLVESASKLIKLSISLNNAALAHLDVLLHVGALSHGLLKTSSGLSQVSLHASLVLLRLGLVLVDGVDLLA